MRIAIVRLSAMGDIVQSMIVLQFIKEYRPDCKIDWFVDRKFSDILNDAKHIDNIFPLNIKGVKLYEFPSKLIKLYKFIRSKGRYDLVIDLQGLIKSGLVSRFISANNRVGFHWASSREPLSAFFYSKTFRIPYEENVIRRYIGLIEKCFEMNVTNDDIVNKKSFFSLTEQTNFSHSDYALFIVGASFESKIYPVEKFAEVSNSLVIDVVVVWHSDNEKILAEKLKKLSPKVIISKKINVDKLKNLISNATIVIGGDTGPTHLAWSMNIPSITIFGPTPMKRNCFITNQNLAVSSEQEINPYKIDKKNMSIKSIDPKKIVNLAGKLILNS